MDHHPQAGPKTHPHGKSWNTRISAPAVSNSNRLPDEQSFIASAVVQIQRIVRGIATRKRVANVLDKQRKNREKRKIGSRTRRKKERKLKIATNTSSLVLCIELMALETPTQIYEVQTTSAPQNCPPSVWGTRALHSSSGVMDLYVAHLAHALLSGFCMARGAAINPTEAGM
jgi:hypothetical protein